MTDLDKRLVQWFRSVIDATDNPQDRAMAYEAIDEIAGWQ